MSPFYTKEGESWREWEGEPKDIVTTKGDHLMGTGVGIFLVPEDPEKIRVSVMKIRGQMCIMLGQKEEQ